MIHNAALTSVIALEGVNAIASIALEGARSALDSDYRQFMEQVNAGPVDGANVIQFPPKLRSVEDEERADEDVEKYLHNLRNLRWPETEEEEDAMRWWLDYHPDDDPEPA